MDDLHRSCFPCHGKDDCARCHRDKAAAPFDHGVRTGWPLNRFHRSLECRKCHKAPQGFSKLEKDCAACHPAWQSAFDHKKTGFPLNEAHAAFGCEGCHAAGEYSPAPSCANCHPDGPPRPRKAGHVP